MGYVLSLELREYDTLNNRAGEIVALDQITAREPWHIKHELDAAQSLALSRFLAAIDALDEGGTRMSRQAIEADVRNKWNAGI